MAKVIFDIIPNIGVQETWEYKTDIITTIKGDESRAQIRPEPRITQKATFGPFEQDQRREFLQTLYTIIKTPHSIPLYAYSAPIAQETLSGNARIYFDVGMVPVNDAGILFLINPQTRVVQEYEVTTVEADGATLSTNLTSDIGLGWVACLGMQAMIDNSNVKINQITGEAEVTHFSWVEPLVQRPGTAASLTTLDGLPVLERKILADTTDEHKFEYDKLDFTAGLRANYSQWDFSVIESEKTFLMQRILDTTDMDYWRLFFDTVRGSWKSFLLSTQLQDIVPTATLTQGATSFSMTDDVDLLLHEYPIWQHFEILYSDGTYSRHTITDTTGTTITFTPALPSDPKVENIQRISYLLKGRMGDTVTFNHGALNSTVSFQFRTTVSG